MAQGIQLNETRRQGDYVWFVVEGKFQVHQCCAAGQHLEDTGAGKNTGKYKMIKTCNAGTQSVCGISLQPSQLGAVGKAAAQLVSQVF
ncbi:hypothetical protein AURDEDRAFT_117637 [Auricularia subglabra TFB-10046 SS5]|uniref:Uncharacterized protein n=1 Tax=Auricularia subglabra (strain TFB-10046 / SS5) TaxID=717982 RepID=J0WPK8_AURST|nr:hypothetical protein AURDEDRAFT_117637 [Auricularia subglabra TFB-10046 SS5]